MQVMNEGLDGRGKREKKGREKGGKKRRAPVNAKISLIPQVLHGCDFPLGSHRVSDL